MAFADEVETTFQKGFGRENEMRENFECNDGLRISMTEEFKMRRTEDKINLSLKFESMETTMNILSELTEDSVETIESSGLTLHEYAETEGVLKAFQERLLELKKTNLDDLVENGTITQEKANFMLERMSQMDGTRPQERLGQNGGSRNFKNQMHKQGKGQNGKK
jgi:hypothetical protein